MPIITRILTTYFCEHNPVGINLPLFSPTGDGTVFSSRQRETRHSFEAIIIPEATMSNSDVGSHRTHADDLCTLVNSLCGSIYFRMHTCITNI